ncbi:MAG TPA: oligopeptide transporter, OPT family [Planctomycetota bacterium]|nr:oligopeptide transporter, OPT family [Planctomycetota bacterium]
MDSSPTPPLAEFTLKAVVVGIVLGVVFGAANAYLGLKVGMTVSASIPAAVMAVAVFKTLRAKSTILEANISQTIGSASTALATGTVFTIPVLFMWGIVPPLWQIASLCFLGGVLGLAAMIPLRRLLIVQEDATLPYPEGRACAEVLRATAGDSSGAKWIFYGIAVGAAVKLAISIAFLMPGEASFLVSPDYLPKAQLAIELSPSLLAVGFILGYRQAAVCVAGGLISALVLTPMIAFFGKGYTSPIPPETVKLVADMDANQIWSRYVKLIGAGAVATAGILTVVRNLPSMIGAVRAVFGGMSGAKRAAASDARTDRDLPGSFVIGAIAFVVLSAGLIPGIFAGEMHLQARLVCAAGVAVFGVLFVTVAARIVGIVGVSSQPTSGITLVTLIGVASVFTAMGWTDLNARAAVLTVGTIVAIAASKAGDISQDLKTGYLVGATPARQQFGQLLGASVACWAVAATILQLGQAYTFGGKDLSAPQATLMKTIIEGVMAHNLPWDLVLSGAGLSIGAMLCGVSGLAFAIGVYLPLATMAPLFVGGCVRALTLRGGSVPEGKSDVGVLAASGLVAGEGLAGVFVAALVGKGWIPKASEAKTKLEGDSGELAVVALILALCGFLYYAAKKR